MAAIDSQVVQVEQWSQYIATMQSGGACII